MFRSDSSLLDRVYPDMRTNFDDDVTVDRVLQLEPDVQCPTSDAIGESDVVIYRLLHLVILNIRVS